MKNNAKTELLAHIKERKVKYVYVRKIEDEEEIEGTLEEVLPLLDFDYEAGYGSQELDGTIWYTDGTWSEREEYDGLEWWHYKKCPPCPLEGNI